MGLLHCAVYMAGIGIASFIFGRILPQNWFDPEHFPFRSFSWERSGSVYLNLNIKKWQNKVPDMSHILPSIMQKKEITSNYRQQLPVMIHETCVAEFIHVLLCIASFHFIRLWPGPGGVITAVLYFLGNVPYILIQRYNRPRLMRLQQKLAGNQAKEASTICQHSY